jgi:hypothetical protein
MTTEKKDAENTTPGDQPPGFPVILHMLRNVLDVWDREGSGILFCIGGGVIRGSFFFLTLAEMLEEQGEARRIADLIDQDEAALRAALARLGSGDDEVGNKVLARMREKFSPTHREADASRSRSDGSESR